MKWLFAGLLAVAGQALAQEPDESCPVPAGEPVHQLDVGSPGDGVEHAPAVGGCGRRRPGETRAAAGDLGGQQLSAGVESAGGLAGSPAVAGGVVTVVPAAPVRASATTKLVHTNLVNPSHSSGAFRSVASRWPLGQKLRQTY